MTALPPQTFEKRGFDCRDIAITQATATGEWGDPLRTRRARSQPVFTNAFLSSAYNGHPHTIFQQIGNSQLYGRVQGLVDDETARHAQRVQGFCGRRRLQ
jgi:hypothetical protein